MKLVKIFLSLVLLGSLFILNGCGGGGGSGSGGSNNNGLPNPTPSNAITAFSIGGNAGVIANNGNSNTIAITVPYGTNVTALVAAFTATGNTIFVGTTPQTSGTTPNDFTTPVTYTLVPVSTSASAKKTAINNIITYTVTVTVASASDKAITAFSLSTTPGTALVTGIISGQNITVTMPYGTNLTSLVATFSTTGTKVAVGSTLQLTGTTTNNYTSAVNYVVTAADGSTATYIVTVVLATDSEKAITSFSLSTLANSIGVTGIISGQNITVTMPHGTDVTNLYATFSINGVSIKIGSIPQTSGLTANDFTNPVTYLVTAADGTIANYAVTVLIASSSAKAMTAFSLSTTLGGLGVNGIINGQNITVTMPYGTNVANLYATFTTDGASVSVNGVTQQTEVTPVNITNPVTYVVTAADGSTANYTVTVIVVPNSAKAITSFSLSLSPGALGVTGVIAGQNITITMAYGVDISILYANFITTGESVSVGGIIQTSGIIANNFTSPLTYTVTAADGSTANYTVTVIISSDVDKTITSFSLSTTLGGMGVTGIFAGQNITVTMPYGTNVANLYATFSTTGTDVTVSGVTQQSGLTPLNFANQVAYVVAAADGSTATYMVTVIVVPNSANDLIAFSLSLSPGALGVTGVIVGQNISVTMPYGTDLSSLYANFITTGESVSVGGIIQTSGIIANDFNNPLIYTVSAANGTTQSYTVTVTVGAAPSSAKAITEFSLSTTIGGPLVVGTIAGQNITVEMPSGTNLTSLIATFTTTGTGVTVNATPQSSGTTANNFTAPVSYIVTAADNTTATYTVRVTRIQYVYVANFTSSGVGTISMFRFTESSGILTALSPSTVTAGMRPYAITLDPSQQHLYVTNFGDNTVSMFNIDPSTGQLTPMSTPTIATGANPTSIVITPLGDYAYVTNYSDNTVSMYGVNPVTGVLSSLGFAPAPTGSNPGQIVLSPSGLYAYVLNLNAGTIGWYSVNSGTGQLTAISSIATGNTPAGMAISPSGNYAYATLTGLSSLRRYSVNTSDGSVALLLNPPPGTITTGNGPERIAFSPSGLFAYVTNRSGGTVSMYSFNEPTGQFYVTLNPGTVAAGSLPANIIFSASGNYAYVGAGGSNAVYMYSVNSTTGQLTALATPSIAAGVNPGGMAFKSQ